VGVGSATVSVGAAVGASVATGSAAAGTVAAGAVAVGGGSVTVGIGVGLGAGASVGSEVTVGTEFATVPPQAVIKKAVANNTTKNGEYRFIASPFLLLVISPPLRMVSYRFSGFHQKIESFSSMFFLLSTQVSAIIAIRQAARSISHRLEKIHFMKGALWQIHPFG